MINNHHIFSTDALAHTNSSSNLLITHILLTALCNAKYKSNNSNRKKCINSVGLKGRKPITIRKFSPRTN